MFALALDKCRTYPRGDDVIDAELAEQDLQSSASATAQCGGEDGSVEFLSDVKPPPVDIHWELIQSPLAPFFCDSRTTALPSLSQQDAVFRMCAHTAHKVSAGVADEGRNSWWVRAGPWACRSSC